jgi:hypothetical protein
VKHNNYHNKSKQWKIKLHFYKRNTDVTQITSYNTTDSQQPATIQHDTTKNTHHTKGNSKETYKDEPSIPIILATLKLNKSNSPITLIINWKKACAYERAIKLKQTLSNYPHLPCTYNKCNFIHLMTDVHTIEINRMYSFNVENM